MTMDELYENYQIQRMIDLVVRRRQKNVKEVLYVNDPDMRTMLRSALFKKRYPSARGYGDYMGRKK